ncbi:hypothetical protein [Acetobacter thailandicus]|uniref:hypothetical protein n=1 Tax=Acetobacter thailandicus TaxID=1502842 RepID=UPI001BA81C84|nr:hypothetical protein [Acetobacter thailandicus]MBS0987014.1 hypothetical protein [Acetobacter thailandicus]
MKMTTLEIIHDNRSTPKKSDFRQGNQVCNRAKNSHLPLRKREKVMQKFRSPDRCLLFLCMFSAVHNLFVPPAKKSSALSKHIHRLQVFAQWNSVVP